MQSSPNIHLSNVQQVYSGSEGRLWELLMGEQIHIGGLSSSADLAARAGIGPGMRGVDLCCATGAGMRFLVRFQNVGHVTGVDATPVMLNLGRKRCLEEGLSDRISFVEAEVPATGLPADQADFVWGEDAWCYVEDKPRLIAEAVRLVKPGGRIAFTDWMEGPTLLTQSQADRFLAFMKFPSLLSLAEYRGLLERLGCQVETAADTGRFASHVPLYIDMIEKQLTYDALKIINFDSALAAALVQEMRFMHTLAQEGRIIQGLVVARKPG